MEIERKWPDSELTPSNDPVERAEDLISEGQLYEAIKFLQQAAKKAPWNHRFNILRVEAFLRLGKYTRAALFLHPLIETQPYNPEIHVLASIFYRSTNPAQSQYHEEEARRLSWNLSRTLEFMANLLCHVGEPKRALSLIKEVLRSQPGNPQAWDIRANCEYQRNRFRPMAGCLQRVLSIKPDWISSHAGLAVAYCYSGQLDKALQLFKQQPSPERYNDSGTVVLMCQLYRWHGEDDQAERIFRYLPIQPRSTIRMLEKFCVGQVDAPLWEIKDRPETFNFLSLYLNQLLNSRKPLIRKGIKLIFEADKIQTEGRRGPIPICGKLYRKATFALNTAWSQTPRSGPLGIAASLAVLRGTTPKQFPETCQYLLEKYDQLKSMLPNDRLAMALMGSILSIIKRYHGYEIPWVMKKHLTDTATEIYKSLVISDPFCAPVYKQKLNGLRYSVIPYKSWDKFRSR